MKKICLLLVLVLSLNVMGKNLQQEQDMKLLPEKKEGGLLVSPVLYYLPETRLAFGVVGNMVFRLGNANGDGRPSTLSPIFIYTQNKQYRFQLNADVYFKRDDYHLLADMKFLRYPDKFFGIGNANTESMEEDFTADTFAVSLSFLKKVAPHTNIGLDFDYSNMDVSEYEAGKQLAGGKIPGSRGCRLSGLGLQVDVDSRDNVFFPSRGVWFKLSAQFNSPVLGSACEFQTYRLDMRKYFSLFSTHVLAIQALFQAQYGDVPFHKLSRLGGQYVMRGYFDGRFRDRDLLALQAEYRLPLFWRLGAVGFVGLGQVAPVFRDFRLDSLKKTMGLGLRYRFNNEENMCLRFDIGFGQDSSGFYFSVFEAF